MTRNERAGEGGGEKSGQVDEYAGTVVKVHEPIPVPVGEKPSMPNGVVDIVTFGSNSVYHNNRVPFDADGKPGTWRYPPLVKDEIEV